MNSTIELLQYLNAIQKQPTEQRVSKCLQQKSIPMHTLGFRYLKTALALLMENDSLIYAMTKELYPAIAKKHNTTPSRVERAMRYSLEIMADRCYIIRPTNSKFLVHCLEELRFQK